MKTILESYSIKELKDFIRSHNKDVRKQTSEKIKEIRKNINKKRIIDIKGLNKKTDKDEIISRMLKEKQHFKDIKMKKQISQEEKEKFMDDVLNPLLKKSYLVYARTGDEDDVEVEIEEIFKKAKEMDIASNYGITKKKMIKLIVDEGKKDKKIRDEIISKRKTDKNIPPPKPPMPPNMFYSTQAKKFIINKPTRPAPKLTSKAKGKQTVKNEEPAPASLKEAVGDRPKKPSKLAPKPKSEPKSKPKVKKLTIVESKPKVKSAPKPIPTNDKLLSKLVSNARSHAINGITIEGLKDFYNRVQEYQKTKPSKLQSQLAGVLYNFLNKIQMGKKRIPNNMNNALKELGYKEIITREKAQKKEESKPKKEEPKKETKREKMIRERKKDRGKILSNVKQIPITWKKFMEDEYLGDDYTLEEQKAEFDDMVKTNKLLPNSLPQRRKLNDFDKPKQEVFLKLFRENFLKYIDLETDLTGQKKEFIKERNKDKKELEEKDKKSKQTQSKKEKKNKTKK